MTFVYNSWLERALPRVLEWNLFASMAAAASRTLCVLLTYLQLAICQYSGGRPVQPAGWETFTLPPPGDPNYRTYVYNNRRYGQALPARPFIPSYNDPSLPNPNSYDPNINRGLPPGEDPNRYMFNDVSIDKILITTINLFTHLYFIGIFVCGNFTWTIKPLNDIVNNLYLDDNGIGDIYSIQ